ncbi:hypothetical protein LTR48_004084 [Friedmanniomyces endolithicus]|uniref:Zn(2)-C6 fungal-type domain-containing protein n=1 Tax=Rachicladosporium monterosium TaxID=1507873 RepID=A0ABR0L911_9PEZI|nr:hypothetical protein LTR29_013740 [Friedmanniomyces endolithicus]KAK1092578.1 hypothetical protein LTR48_004084 [Friedmanniomyces endolithicus]KAK5145320.1 hypothetical protein LTR32_002907 [Rachicladosporium monterosium]
MFNNTTHNHFLPISSTLSIAAASGLGRPLHADQSSVASSTTSDATFQSHTALVVRKRKSPKIKSGKQLSRSFSTPQLRDDAMSDSDSDKKRNKLGYQRISIACAHCRRRKIRCIISDGDSHQRCQNCIRLKKDCAFYAVDQQAAMEGRPETSATLLAGSGPSSIVSLSPPNMGMDRPLASAHDFPAFSAVPSNAPSTYDRLPLEPGSALLGQQTPQHFLPTEPDPRLAGFVQPNHTYRAETDTRSWSASAALESSGGGGGGGSRLLARRAEGSAQMYARYTHSAGNVRADFAPYPAAAVAATEPTRTQNAFHRLQGGGDYTPNNREGMQWEPSQPSGRSTLPYAQIEHQQPPHHPHHQQQHQQQQQQQQPPYQPPFRPDQRVHPMQHYPLSALDVHNANLPPNGRGHPLSAPVGPVGTHQVYSQAHAFMYQQQQQQSHSGGGGGGDGGTGGVNASFAQPLHATFPPAGGWYAEQQTYSALVEEEGEAEEFGGSPELRPG